VLKKSINSANISSYSCGRGSFGNYEKEMSAAFVMAVRSAGLWNFFQRIHHSSFFAL
jgi:hypothetical protein